MIRSELTLVDLAGSEKLTLMSKNPSAKLMQESIEINASLLALGKVISSLGEKGGKCHVPYRDSKLTKLLKHALGGNSLTIMVACINPCDAYVEETVSTLFYSGRARNIRNDPRVNEDGKTSLIKALRAEIASLKTELSHFRKLAVHGDTASHKSSSSMPRPGPPPSGPPDAASFEGRPHTAGEVDQSREVTFLGEKLVDSVTMLKDIILVNGQLREAVDEMGNAKLDAEANMGQLNEENIQLRERIEMLESIVIQDRDGSPQRQRQKKAATAAAAPRADGSPVRQPVTSPEASAPRPAPQGHGRKALEKYRTRYKQAAVPSYNDYYSVASTRQRTSKADAKRGPYGGKRAFEGLQVKRQQPLFTKRASVDASPGGLQVRHRHAPTHIHFRLAQSVISFIVCGFDGSGFCTHAVHGSNNTSAVAAWVVTFAAASPGVRLSLHGQRPRAEAPCTVAARGAAGGAAPAAAAARGWGRSLLVHSSVAGAAGTAALAATNPSAVVRPRPPRQLPHARRG